MKKKLVLSLTIGLLLGLPACGGCGKKKCKQKETETVIIEQEEIVEETPEKVAKF